MKRHPQWEARLHASLEKLRAPHVYGKNDCLVGLAAGVIKAVTGKDLARGHRAKYDSPATAVRYLRTLGFDSPEALLDDLLPEKAVGFAQRGDLVLVPGNEGEWNLPAVCVGALAYALFDDGRLHPIPRSQWLKAWRVG